MPLRAGTLSSNLASDMYFAFYYLIRPAKGIKLLFSHLLLEVRSYDRHEVDLQITFQQILSRRNPRNIEEITLESFRR